MSNTRWLNLLIPAIVVAGVSLSIERLMNWQRPPQIQAIVVASVVVILISLIGYLSKLRD